jgi:hypothetical protein
LRKLLTPDDFPNFDLLAERLAAFENRYNHASRPFDWRFTEMTSTDSWTGSPRDPDELTGVITEVFSPE